MVLGSLPGIKLLALLTGRRSEKACGDGLLAEYAMFCVLDAGRFNHDNARAAMSGVVSLPARFFLTCESLVSSPAVMLAQRRNTHERSSCPLHVRVVQSAHSPSTLRSSRRTLNESV